MRKILTYLVITPMVVLTCSLAAIALGKPSEANADDFQKRAVTPVRPLNYLFCFKSKPDEYRRFGTISGTMASNSIMTVTGSCFGTQKSLFLVYTSATGQPVVPIYDSFAGAIEEKVFTNAQLQIQVPQYTTVRPPLAPPKVLVLERKGINGINFRAVLTQQDVDTLQSGGTLSNPPVSR
jgi:hypothetical protein